MKKSSEVTPPPHHLKQQQKNTVTRHFHVFADETGLFCFFLLLLTKGVISVNHELPTLVSLKDRCGATPCVAPAISL